MYTLFSEDLASPTGPQPPISNFSVGGEVLARSPVGSVADLSGGDTYFTHDEVLG